MLTKGIILESIKLNFMTAPLATSAAIIAIIVGCATLYGMYDAEQHKEYIPEVETTIPRADTVEVKLQLKDLEK